jgi:peptidoglycan/LPS O-acetylase OafA/YrhL
VSAMAGAAAGPKHIPALDGLRAVAVGLVLVAHLPDLAPGTAPRIITALCGIAGYVGVDVFFVLSGFLITRILIADAAAGRPLRRFWGRRFLRIFPAYYMLLIGVALVAPGPSLPWCATYLSNYYFALGGEHDALLGHTWSLAVEEHFYLVWPFVVMGLAPRVAKRALLFVIIPGALLSATLPALLEMPYAAGLVYEGTHARALSLGLGCLLAFDERTSVQRPLTSRQTIALIASAGAAWIATLLVAQTRLGPVGFMVGYAWICRAALVLVLRAPHPIVTRIASAASLRHVGSISYGLYLYHPPAYALIAFAIPESLWPLRIPLAVLAAYAIARISFAVVEQPLLRLKERFR